MPISPVATATMSTTYTTVRSATISSTTGSTQASFDFWINVSPSSTSVTAGEALWPIGTVSVGPVNWIDFYPSSTSVTAGKELWPAGTLGVGHLHKVPYDVVFSVSGLPPSVGTDDLSSYSCTPPCSRSFGIRTSGISTGTHTLTITATGGGMTHSATFTLIVTKPVAPKCECGPPKCVVPCP
jgi:hypothetical protein